MSRKTLLGDLAGIVFSLFGCSDRRRGEAKTKPDPKEALMSSKIRVHPEEFISPMKFIIAAPSEPIPGTHLHRVVVRVEFREEPKIPWYALYDNNYSYSAISARPRSDVGSEVNLLKVEVWHSVHERTYMFTIQETELSS